MRRRWPKVSCAVALSALVGCGGDAEAPFGEGEGEPDPFEEFDPAELSPGNAVAFATASAPAMFAVGLAPLVALGLDMNEDCPNVTESGTTTVYEGGCTQSNGNAVYGTATVEETGNGGGTIRYESFGWDAVDMCMGVDVEESVRYAGNMVVDELEEANGTFELNLTLEYTAADGDSCATVRGSAAYEYEGRYRGAPNPDGALDLNARSTWNGSGRLGVEPYGMVNASTDDEVIDQSVCETESLSGTTSIESAGDVVEVLYDGEDDCDVESTAQWSLNGEPQGEMTGVTCSLPPAPPSKKRMRDNGWLFLALGALACARRWRMS